MGLAAAHAGVREDEVGEAVFGAREGVCDVGGRREVDAVVGGAAHRGRPHPAEVEQGDPASVAAATSRAAAPGPMPLLATESRVSRPCGARASASARRSAPASPNPAADA